jgi:hypothetical protein
LLKRLVFPSMYVFNVSVKNKMAVPIWDYF